MRSVAALRLAAYDLARTSEASGNHALPDILASLYAGGILKKSLPFVVLAGLMLTGCGGKQASVESQAPATASAVAAAAAEGSIAVPDVVGLTLDKATDQLKDLGLKASATDVNDGKRIFNEKNWRVVSVDPLGGTKAAEGSPVKLGVGHLTDEMPAPAPAQVGPVAPPVVVAPPAVEAPPVKVAPPAVEAPPVYGGIICKDGYAWPGATRQGACRGHGGIAN